MIQDVLLAQAQDGHKYQERLRLLREIDRAILRAQSVDQTAAAAVRGFRQLVPCRRASVARFDFAADQVILLATSSDSELQLRAGAQAQLSRAFFLGDSPQGQPHLVADLDAVPFTHPWVDLLRGEGVRGYASLPLVAEGQVIGALTIGLACPGLPSPDALEIAADVADQLAVAILEARLRQEIRGHAAELTARVAARTEALRMSEARFRAVFEAAPIGMALISPDGQLLQSNPALQRLLGWDETAQRETRLTDLLKNSEDRLKLTQHLAQEAVVQQTRFEAELALLRRDGRTLWARLTLSRVPATSDAGDLMIAMVEDVTEARHARAALIQAERLTITGRLGASLTHEINNPLQSIIGCLSLAEETLADPAEAGRYLAVAREELRRVTRITAQLRDLQDGAALEQAEQTDLNAILTQLLTLNAARCSQQGVEIDWQPAHRLPSLLIVPDRIRQVFLNILLNALDAMPQGGRLTVRAARTQQPPGVRVTIRDTGPGMPPDVADRIFEPFYSTKKTGLGLGLFTSRNIIEQHGGAIEVRSRPGQGTTFVVWLPAHQGRRP